MGKRPQHLWCNREAVQPVLVKAVVVVLVLVPGGGDPSLSLRVLSVLLLLLLELLRLQQLLLVSLLLLLLLSLLLRLGDFSLTLRRRWRPAGLRRGSGTWSSGQSSSPTMSPMRTRQRDEILIAFIGKSSFLR